VVCWALLLQAKRETNDDRQREYEERLRHHEHSMAQARQALQAAEASLAQVQEHKGGLRDAIQRKEAEVQQLQIRCVVDTQATCRQAVQTPIACALSQHW